MSEVEHKDCTEEQAAAEYKVAKTFILFACGGTGSNFTQRALLLLKTRKNRKHRQQFVILDKSSNLSSRSCISRCANHLDFFQKTKVSKSIMFSDFNKKATTTLAKMIATFTRSPFAKTHFNRDSVSFTLMEMSQKKMLESLRLHEYARISYRRILSTAFPPYFIQISFAALKGHIFSLLMGDLLCNLTTKYDSVAFRPLVWWFKQYTRRSAVA